MSYDLIGWVNDESALSAENFNHMDEGIKKANDLADKNASDIAEFANEQIPEEYVRSAVDTYIEENEAGIALKEEVEALDAKIDAEVSSLSSEIVEIDDYINRIEWVEHLGKTNGKLSNGVIVDSADYFTTGFIPCANGRKVTVIGNASNVIYAQYSDENESSLIYSTTVDISGSRTFAFGIETKYVRFCFWKTATPIIYTGEETLVEEFDKVVDEKIDNAILNYGDSTEMDKPAMALGNVYVDEGNLVKANSNVRANGKLNYVDGIYTIIPKINDVVVAIIKQTEGIYSDAGMAKDGLPFTFVVDRNIDSEYLIKYYYSDDRVVTLNENDFDIVCSLVSPYIEERFNNIESKSKMPNQAKGLFCLMGYNCGGWYQGSGTNIPIAQENNFLSMQKSIINRYSPDILCVCEYWNQLSNNYNAKDKLLSHFYENIQTIKDNTQYFGKCIATNRDSTIAEEIGLVTGSGFTALKSYVYLNGKKVCVICTHLEPQNSTARSEGADTLIAEMSKEQYVILYADFNVDAKNKDSDDYRNVFQKFKNAGYTVVNDGMIDTYHAGLETEGTALDDVIVSNNINVKSFVVDEQKRENENVTAVDHFPISVYFEI